jgi:hypothetical protein
MQIVLALVAALAPMPCYVPPVAEPVVVPFDQPACDYCPGHRGLEYDIAESTAVHAVAAGTVTFSGLVVGTRYVVVLQDDGLTATYGRLSTARVGVADRVGAGQAVGMAAGRLYLGCVAARSISIPHRFSVYRVIVFGWYRPPGLGAGRVQMRRRGAPTLLERHPSPGNMFDGPSTGCSTHPNTSTPSNLRSPRRRTSCPRTAGEEWLIWLS